MKTTSQVCILLLLLLYQINPGLISSRVPYYCAAEGIHSFVPHEHKLSAICFPVTL